MSVPALTLEVLAVEIRHEREMRLALERRIQERADAERRALEIQAREYERRLKDLNHEAERLKAAAALAVSREVYDAERKSTDRRISALERIESASGAKAAVVDPAMERLMRQVETIATRQTTQSGTSAGISMAWAWALGAFGIIGTLVGLFAFLTRGGGG